MCWNLYIRNSVNMRGSTIGNTFVTATNYPGFDTAGIGPDYLFIDSSIFSSSGGGNNITGIGWIDSSSIFNGSQVNMTVNIPYFNESSSRIFRTIVNGATLNLKNSFIASPSGTSTISVAGSTLNLVPIFLNCEDYVRSQRSHISWSITGGSYSGTFGTGSFGPVRILGLTCDPGFEGVLTEPFSF